jgi:nucleoside-diphosphate-sugar epimerase
MSATRAGFLPLRIVVTGASGFVGSALVTELEARGHQVSSWSRQCNGFDLDRLALENIAAHWQQQLGDIDVVVHAAARVHQIHETSTGSAQYQQINADATFMLARIAQQAGVKRLVFFSTAKVYGEGSAECYRESNQPEPQGEYAKSKLHAEQLLLRLSEATGINVVILRPPLVYGLGVGGNFETLWKIANTGWPLPLAQVHNRRDMIAIDNLTEIAAICCEDVRAVGQIFNVADAQPYSLSEIICSIRRASAQRERLWSLPEPLLQKILIWLRGADDAQRLLGSFRLDTELAQRTLDWRPRADMKSTVEQMARST